MPEFVLYSTHIETAQVQVRGYLVIPDFTEDGVLPPGIHRANKDEFRRRFAVFDHSDQRLRTCEHLDRLLAEAKTSGIVLRVLIAGSFVTAKAEPNDFDCILVLNREIIGRSLPPFQYNIVSRKMARRLFGGDVVPVLEGSVALAEYLDFFQTTRTGQRVGLVEIEL